MDKNWIFIKDEEFGLIIKAIKFAHVKAMAPGAAPQLHAIRSTATAQPPSQTPRAATAMASATARTSRSQDDDGLMLVLARREVTVAAEAGARQVKSRAARERQTCGDTAERRRGCGGAGDALTFFVILFFVIVFFLFFLLEEVS